MKATQESKQADKQVESTQETLVSGNVETPVISGKTENAPEVITIGKRSFDKVQIDKSIQDALSDAGRWRKLAGDAGLMRKVNEADASQASIFVPSVIRDLVKAGKINRQHGNRLLALCQLVQAFETLSTPISDAK